MILARPASEEAVIELDPNRLRPEPSWAAYPNEDGTWAAHCEHCGWVFEAHDEGSLDERRADHDLRVHGVASER